MHGTTIMHQMFSRNTAARKGNFPTDIRGISGPPIHILTGSDVVTSRSAPMLRQTVETRTEPSPYELPLSNHIA